VSDAIGHIVAGQESAIRCAEFFVAIPAPELPLPGEEDAQSLQTLFVLDHQQR
jgi:hypothetical protein